MLTLRELAVKFASILDSLRIANSELLINVRIQICSGVVQHKLQIGLVKKWRMFQRRQVHQVRRRHLREDDLHAVAVQGPCGCGRVGDDVSAERCQVCLVGWHRPIGNVVGGLIADCDCFSCFGGVRA